MPASADPYRTSGFVMGPDLVVRVCKYCGELRSICDKQRGGDDLSGLECEFKRRLEHHFARETGSPRR